MNNWSFLLIRCFTFTFSLNPAPRFTPSISYQSSYISESPLPTLVISFFFVSYHSRHPQLPHSFIPCLKQTCFTKSFPSYRLSSFLKSDSTNYHPDRFFWATYQFLFLVLFLFLFFLVQRGLLLAPYKHFVLYHIVLYRSLQILHTGRSYQFIRIAMKQSQMGVVRVTWPIFTARRMLLRFRPLSHRLVADRHTDTVLHHIPC